MTISASIDLSHHWGPALDQGMRPTCLAFALSQINAHANQVSALLSAEYLYRSVARQTLGWKAGDGLRLAPALLAVSCPGQPTADLCPYLVAEPAETPPMLPGLTPSDTGEAPPLYSSAMLACVVDATAVVTHLQAGHPIGLVLKLTETFYTPVKGTIAFSQKVLQGLRHAVVAVGTGVHAGTSEPHIKIRNSWGESWGDAGSAWLPFTYVDAHAVTAFKV
ncbi:Papain family cysteine protease [Variovorax sp. YR266]|uniref:C1 family peptidase n=1 Tax=Variovorax sp. YR266 TaxID=1884386 RepID=UPI00089913E2|nr:C1 family peptidase [Variovorax sp. YR266]SDY97517.1 Papain family cysteine protease [Variovorax sp. YR266]